ncbi:hypothetical protein RP20_CCG014095 [Aedes albopictus]|nr:golgin candidate 3-like [Aedes albopictus]KXJ74236.1 hypothetical protein RP20_CCG014095 [Aedes albopictus]
MEMENLEKMDSMSDLHNELAELQERMQTSIEGISQDAQAAANAKVESNHTDPVVELECKRDWEESLPGFMDSARVAKRQLPSELEDLYVQERELERGLLHRREAIQSLLDETATTKWADIDSARRRATVLRQHLLQKKTEEEEVRCAIQELRDNTANRVASLMQLLEEMKQRKVRLQAKQAEQKLKSKRLDDELERLVRELNALKTANAQ